MVFPSRPRMRLAPILALTFLASLGASAEAPTATVQAAWRVGDIRTLRVSQSRSRSQQGKELASSSGQYDVDITVKTKDREGYLLEWRYSNVRSANSAGNALADRIAGLSEGLTASYRTDTDGAFDRLENWEEIQDFLLSAVDRIGAAQANPQLMAALDQVKGIYKTRKSIEQLALKEVQVYHALYGGEYALGEALVLDTQLANFIGGDPFPAVLSYEMTEYSPEAGTCRVRIEQAIDAEAARRNIRDFLVRTAKALGKSEPTEADIPQIAIKDLTEFTVDLKGGWITQLVQVREIRSADMVQVDRLEIEGR